MLKILIFYYIIKVDKNFKTSSNNLLLYIIFNYYIVKYYIN